MITSLILLKNNSLVSGSLLDGIKVWNKKNEYNFKCVATLNESRDVFSLAISGSSLLIRGHLDGSIQIRNQTSFDLFQTLKKHTSTVKSIILLNNENLASGSADNTIIIWQKMSEISFKLSNILTGHTDWVTSLTALPNNMFASASYDKSIRIWDQITFQCFYILNGHTYFINGLIVIRNEYLISISNDKTIIVWYILNSSSRTTITQTSAPIRSICFKH